MVRTSSNMLRLGSLLPAFELSIIHVNDKQKINSPDRFDGNMLNKKPVLLMFLCAHCPFVKHLESELTRLDKDFGRDIQIFAVGSNCLDSHPEDGPEYLAKQMISNDWTFPYLIDSEQKLAKSLKAACTPEFFLFSSTQSQQKELVYRGQFDDSRPGNNIDPSGSDLREAIDAVLNSRKVSFNQKPSIGCNIKWKSGSEPLWFD